MSKIIITDLEVQFCVGVPDEERSKPQRLLLSVEMEHDFSAAVATDDISATIDYFDVSQKIIALGTGRSWRLIEKLANDVADLVLTGYRPTTATVIVKKFPIPQAAQVAVTLTKHRA
ncbi:MAG: dihydroneopterin aldolase [Verrucomicrobiota bacterium]